MPPSGPTTFVGVSDDQTSAYMSGQAHVSVTGLPTMTNIRHWFNVEA